MGSNHEDFFLKSSFAIVGHSAKKNFPKLTYGGLKQMGKTVYAVDPGSNEIEGDKAYPDLASLPGKVEAVVLELPKEETADWVAKAAEAGIKDLWVHMNTETDEALVLAREKGMNLRTGTCAVMYVTPGFSFHSFHKWIMKLRGKY